MTDYAALGKSIGELVQSKNSAYGDSFSNSGKILAILYPNGVKPEQYTDMLTVVRILDKLARVATRKDAFGESPFKDIAGYGILGYAKDGGPKKVDGAKEASYIAEAIERYGPNPPKPLDIAGKEPVEIFYPDDPMCMICGVNVIPVNRAMYCGDECLMSVYPREDELVARWQAGEGRHGQPWDTSKKP